MSEKIVLIDGNSIMNRAFFGVPVLTNSKGVHTNAVYGFLNIMFKMLDEESPQYLAVAFDVHAPTFRHKLYAEYKGTRKGMPEELREQMPLIKAILKAMDICTVEREGFEADDILGTIAKDSEERGLQVSLISGDRDLLQIASDNIKIRIPKTKGGRTEVEDYHTKDVIERYGLTPEQIIELKALMGDASDNIPGVPKIGEKTATALIQEYGSIENLKLHRDEISKKSIRESLIQNFELAELSKTLATIDIHADIDTDPERMRIGSIYTKQAYDLIKELEFKNMAERFEGLGLSDDIGLSCCLVYEEGEVFELFERLKECRVTGFKLFRTDRLFGAAFCSDEKKAYFIPVRSEGMRGADEELVLRLMTGLFTKTEAMFPTFGLKEAFHLLPELADFELTGRFFDTKLAAYLLNPLKSDYEPEDVAIENGIRMRSYKELFGKSGFEAAFASDADAFCKYACKCAYAVFSSYEGLKDKLGASGMSGLFEEIEMPLTICLYGMEHEGIRILPDKLKEYGDELGRQILLLEEKIHREAGSDFNINSPRQLGEVLFDTMKLPGAKKTKTGYSTSADILEKLSGDYPFVKDVLEYRGLSKLKSTYADGLSQFIGDEDRIHSTFHQTITATGRISSADPNLQNIPVRMEQGRQIRRVFVPREGYVFLDADYSQIELRILSHMSGDESLLKAFSEGMDIHRMTASKIFNTPFSEVTALQRRNAKAVNFGIIYGISSFGLAQDTGLSNKEAQEFIDSYFLLFPKIKEFLDGLVSSARSKGYAETLFGRRRPVPELKESNFMRRQFGERVAMNAPIQGTAADIMKIAMIRVARRLKSGGYKSRLILQIHDELLIEALAGEKEEVAGLLVEEMENAASLDVRLVAELNEGSTWYDAK
ncbi:MAG TPA: DNA polymerase I [Lachnospiraceae bacterium]|nr:DNA polymerase I [Lachnospiraceae bacterium]